MSQIRLAAMAVALSVVGFATTGLAQQAQRPQIETTKVDGTDNVYIFRNGNHQSMFIVTTDGVSATDPIAYGRPTGGQDYIAEIKKVTYKPIKFLIYSHHHYDHIAGGKPFKDAGATIVAHRRAKERLAVLKDPNTPLPGHPGQPGGRLGTKKDAQDILTLMQEASAEMKKMGQDGKCWEPAEKDFKLPKYANWPGYENGLQFVARRYCGLWGRGT